jgi:hypothetical protein
VPRRGKYRRETGRIHHSDEVNPPGPDQEKVGYIPDPPEGVDESVIGAPWQTGAVFPEAVTDGLLETSV